MLRQFLGCGLVLSLLLSLSWASYGGDKGGANASTTPSNAALEKLKKLAGTWVSVDKDGKATDQVVSVYTVDGPDLIMTHYCVLGNQPRMKADPNSPSNQIVWRFAGGSNLNVAKDKHMHEATLTIVSDDRIEVQGTGWENGAPAKEMCCGLKLVRKK